jgi:hypothetical protein
MVTHGPSSASGGSARAGATRRRAGVDHPDAQSSRTEQRGAFDESHDAAGVGIELYRSVGWRSGVRPARAVLHHSPGVRPANCGSSGQARDP